MKPLLCSLAIVLTLAAVPAAAQDWSKIRQKAQGSVAFIEVVSEKLDGSDKDVSTSTGFVISPLGFAITAAHAVPRATRDRRVSYQASIGGRHAHKFGFQVVHRIEELDLALIKFPSSGFTWLPVEFGESTGVPPDARLYVLGFPGRSDLASAEGLLSNPDGPDGRWQTTLPLTYGNSGGPVFDIGGRVIGVAVGGFDQEKAQTFVVPSDYALLLRTIVRASLDENPLIKTFTFALTANHEERKQVNQHFCLEEGVEITIVKPTVKFIGGDTQLISAARSPGRPNCVELKAQVAGNGVDKVGPIIVGHRGRGWLSGEIAVQAAR